MAIVSNLKHWDDGSWTWEVEGSEGCFYTDKNGEGLFIQDKYGNTRQVLGTCQFRACKTVSGMRSKLNRMYKED